MLKRLEKYRKSNKLSKSQIAKKLGITKKDYDKLSIIEEKQEIDNDLKKRIEKLLSSSKQNNIKKGVEIPKGFDNTLTLIDKLNKTTNPLNIAMDSFNESYKSPLYFVDALSKLNNTIKPKLNTWSNFGYTVPNKIPEIVNITTQFKDNIPYKELENTTKVLQGILNDDSLSSLQNSITTINKINIPNIDVAGIDIPDFFHDTEFLSLSKTIERNKSLYADYIGFSAELADTLAPIIDNSKFYFPKELYHSPNKLSELDFLTGSSFLAFEHYQDFSEEKEVLQKIQENNEHQNVALGIIEEFNEVIDDSTKQEDYDFSIIEELYIKFYTWISKTFQKTIEKAQQIAQAIMVNSKMIIFILSTSLALYTMNTNATGQNEILHEVKKINNDSDNLDNKPQRMQLLNDTVLRAYPNNQAKIKDNIGKGQVVEVLEKRVKWMKISCDDYSTQEPKIGWVRIEFFIDFH